MNQKSAFVTVGELKYNGFIMPKSYKYVKTLLLVFLSFLLLAACAGPTPTAVFPTFAVSTPIVENTATAVPSATPSPTPAATATPTATATALPSATPSPTPILAGSVPLIEYHDPDFKLNEQVQMTIPWFEDQLNWLSTNGYSTLDGEEFAAYLDGTADVPQKSVVLTFDIGVAKRSIYVESVIPLLRKYHFKAVFFILANDLVVSDDCKTDPRHFCWSDFREWADEGLISIASHGLYHPDFTTLTPTQIKYEVETPLQILPEKTGHLPVAFAYPFDTSSQAAINIVKAAGYKFAVAGNTRSLLAAEPNDVDRFKLPRVYPYSNQRMYPNLNGFNKPFGDVISGLNRPKTSAIVSAVTQTPIAGSGSTADEVLKFCRSLPSEPTMRLNDLIKSSFQADVSAEAQAQLPGLTTSISCNVLPDNHPEAIVVHYTVGELNASLYSFRQANGTSAHYIIDRDGTVVQAVPELLSALHASCTGNRSTCVPSCPICDDSQGRLTEPYTRSIGIELVNKGRIPTISSAAMVYEDYLRSFAYPYWEDYPQAQIDALKVLVEDIARRWKIPLDEQHVIGHYRINQKVDPGPALNLFWARSGNPPRPPIFTAPATP